MGRGIQDTSAISREKVLGRYIIRFRGCSKICQKNNPNFARGRGAERRQAGDGSPGCSAAPATRRALIESGVSPALRAPRSSEKRGINAICSPTLFCFGGAGLDATAAPGPARPDVLPACCQRPRGPAEARLGPPCRLPARPERGFHFLRVSIVPLDDVTRMTTPRDLIIPRRVFVIFTPASVLSFWRLRTRNVGVDEALIGVAVRGRGCGSSRPAECPQ